MATKLVCNSCGRTIPEGAPKTTIRASSMEEPNDEGEGSYDLHNSCWRRIKAKFKIQGE